MRTDKVILGDGCIYSTDCAATGLNNNILVCGATGTGKTVSVTEPRLLNTYQSSMIVTVTKRQIIHKYKRMLLSRGYEVLDLDFAHPLNSDIGYDPLDNVNSVQDIMFLAETVTAPLAGQSSNSDPYWVNAAKSLLASEIAFTMMTIPDATFADVVKIHESFRPIIRDTRIEVPCDLEFAALEKRYPNCYAVTSWHSYRCLPSRTAGCVYGMLTTALSNIFAPDFCKAMGMRRRVNFSTIGTHRTILFLTTSPVNPASNRLVNLFYSQAFQQLFECAEGFPNGKLPIPVHMICDDFATGGKIPNFEEYISIFREKQISVTLLLQSESQLSSIYGGLEATTIINNCDTYLYLGGMDLQTAQNISIRLNAPLEDVLYMPVGQVILFRRGQKPIVGERYHIEKDEEYIRVVRQCERQAAEKNDMMVL